MAKKNTGKKVTKVKTPDWIDVFTEIGATVEIGRVVDCVQYLPGVVDPVEFADSYYVCVSYRGAVNRRMGVNKNKLSKVAGKLLEGILSV